MLKELKFVQGAVSKDKKELIAGMSHFAIENKTIRAYNGTLALSSPLPFDIDCKPKASQLVAAIGNCSPDHVVSISMTPGGKLSIKSGPFRALVECITEETPHVEPEGDDVLFSGSALREAFKALIPFVGTDASKPWTNGIFLSGQSAFATNNVIIVEYWLGTPMPFNINIPLDTVREFLRVGEEPTHAQIASNSITFHFPDGKWIRSGLLNTDWPIAQIQAILGAPAKPGPMDPAVFEGLDAIKPFLDMTSAIGGSVYFRDGHMATHLSDDLGATYDLVDFPHIGCYAMPMLKMLDGIVDSIDWSLYPKPVIFYAHENKMRGSMMGRSITPGS